MKPLTSIFASILCICAFSACNTKNNSPEYVKPIYLSELSPLKPGQKSTASVILATRTDVSQWKLSFQSTEAFLRVDFGTNPFQPETGLERNFSVQAETNAIIGNYQVKIIATGSDGGGNVLEVRSLDLAVQIIN